MFKCDGQFSRVTPDIDIDPSDYVYVIDIERENAQKFDSDGRGVYITDTGDSPILIFGLVKSIEIENTVCN